jgi:GxxExxY protein
MEYNLLKKQEEQEKDHREMTYQIIGAAMAVHRALGHGFLEGVYGDALEIEFQERMIPFEREKTIDISYKGKPLKHHYVADFVCFDSIIVELKAVDSIMPVHRSQLINYLNATDYHIGLLINFGESSLKYERFRN